MNPSILITGSTGTLGSSLFQKLKNSTANVVAGVREINAAREKHGYEANVVVFDYADPTTFENATNGIDRVFIVGPALNTELDQLLTPFLDFLKSKGILRVVYISALGLEKVPELPFHTVIENKLEKEGFEYTILRPSFFAQNFKNFEWENIVQRGIIYTVGGSGKVGFIDVEDIVAVAARVLIEPGHQRKIYELTGPELLSYYEVAEILSAIIGKKIVYPDPGIEEFKSTLLNAGAPAFVTEYMTQVYGLIRNHHVNYLTDTVLHITGKKPNTLNKVLENDFLPVAV